jgi:hypothetical protein
MRPLRTLCCIAACFSATCLAASAQEVVHALQGTVQNTNPKAGTISLNTGDELGGSFKDMPSANAAKAIDKDLRAEVVPAGSFTNKGDQVILLYEGYGEQRTAVAVHDLGVTPVTDTVGTVQRFDKHVHILTIKTDAGKPATFHLDAKTIADAPNGATDGLRYEPSKGDHVKIASVTDSGNQLAVFIGPAD